MTDIVFIDWMEKSINVYEFTKTGNDYELADSRAFTIEDELTPSLLESLVEEKPEKLYLSLPLDLLTLREQLFPFSDKEKIRDTIAYELEGTLLESIDSYSIDHIITESFDDSSKVMAVCLEKTKLQEIIGTFSSAGLDPKVITSIDLWLYGGKGEDFLGKPIYDKSVRAETARKELDRPSINLRQNELAFTGDLKKFKKGLRVTAALLLVLLVLIGVFSTIRLMTEKKENTELSGQMQALYRKVFPGEKKVIDVGRQFKGKYNTLKKKKEALAGISMLDILLEVALKNDRAVTFHELNADGKNIIVKGTASSFEDVEAIKNSFTKSFQKVKVTDSSSGVDKKVAFTMQMLEGKL
jgi:type II secretory pathway component PulL